MDTLCRLMPPVLPSQIDPERLSRKGESISGEYAVNELGRLAGLVYDTEGNVNFKLEFSFIENPKLPLITGQLKAHLNLVCQRCLDAFHHQIEREIKLVVINKDFDQETIPAEYEFVVSNHAADLKLKDLIEDEIILAIPISIMHDENECKASKLVKSVNRENKTSPFAILKDIGHKQ